VGLILGHVLSVIPPRRFRHDPPPRTTPARGEPRADGLGRGRQPVQGRPDRRLRDVQGEHEESGGGEGGDDHARRVRQERQELLLQITGSLDGKPTPPQGQKIDLTRPFDPAKGSPAAGAGEPTAEKLKDGKETVKAGGKEYDCTWTTYKVTAKAGNATIQSELKVWLSKDAPLPMVKTTSVATDGKVVVETTMELTEPGTC
jgi:hypothetical protein